MAPEIGQTVGEDNSGLDGWNSREPDLMISRRFDFDEQATVGSLPVQSVGSSAACGDEAGEENDDARRDLYVL